MKLTYLPLLITLSIASNSKSADAPSSPQQQPPQQTAITPPQPTAPQAPQQSPIILSQRQQPVSQQPGKEFLIHNSRTVPVAISWTDGKGDVQRENLPPAKTITIFIQQEQPIYYSSTGCPEQKISINQTTSGNVFTIEEKCQ